MEQVRLARELGFSSLFAGQHFLSDPFQMFQPIPLLASLAAEAEGMTIGPGVLLLPLLNPVEVAEHAATLDAISGGGVTLGVGIGYRPVEYAAFGVAKGRGDAFEQRIDVVRALLAGEAVTATGPGFSLDGARLSLVPERPPPIWIAANSDRAVARAARLGDAWLLNPHTTLDELERQVALFHDARQAAGRAPLVGLPILREVCVAESDEAAMEAARPHLEGKYAAYVDWGQSEVMPGQDTLRREWNQLTAGGRFIIGSPGTCAALLREHVDRLGVGHFLCRVQWPGMPQRDVLRSLRLLATEVLPALGP